MDQPYMPQQPGWPQQQMMQPQETVVVPHPQVTQPGQQVDPAILDYQDKLAMLVEDLDLNDPEVQHKFAGDRMGGLLAGRVCVETMDELNDVPLVQDSFDVVQGVVDGVY